MEFGIIGIVVAIIAFLLIIKVVKFGLKILFFFILAIAFLTTIWICNVQPDIHNPFAINTIEYLFKINKDGSLTTTKQITETVIQDKGVAKQ